MKAAGLPRELVAPDRRTELAAAVANLAVAIANGEVTPQILELEALALICEEQALPAEAARIRRWMARARAGESR